MNVAYIPFNSTANAFTGLFKQAIEEAGNTVCDGSLDNGVGTLKSADCVILNWYEELPKHRVKKYFSFAKKIFYIALCKIYKVKIICVFHNRESHDSKSNFLQKLMRRIFFLSSEKIILLSKKSVDYLEEISKHSLVDKACYIPHPNYIGVYGDFIDSTKEHRQMNVLFLGAVRRYKNIELIIKLANETKDCKINYYIAGKPSDDAYKAELLNMSKNSSNLKFKLEYIEDSEISEIIGASDIIIMPYDKSSLNSGSAIMAFSYGKTIICPEIASIYDFDVDDMYSYNYCSDDEHYDALKAALIRAYNDFCQDKTILRSKGIRLREFVEKNNSVEAMSESLSAMFQSIERG